MYTREEIKKLLLAAASGKDCEFYNFTGDHHDTDGTKAMLLGDIAVEVVGELKEEVSRLKGRTCNHYCTCGCGGVVSLKD